MAPVSVWPLRSFSSSFVGLAVLVSCATKPALVEPPPAPLATVAADAQVSEDAAPAPREADERDLASLEQALGPVEDDASAPKRRACKTNSAGVCVYRTKKRNAGAEIESFEPIPYDDAEQRWLAAYRAYEGHAPADERLRARRYQHIRLRLQHNDFDAAQPLLESYVADYDGHPSSVWAAFMLLDLLVIRVTATDLDDTPVDALLATIEQLQTRTLWAHADARVLHEWIPMLQAGALWRLGTRARDEGSDASRARRDADLDDPEPPPNPDPHFRRCADIFLDIHERFDDHDRADTLLWNAADCLDAAREPERAITVRAQLLERYPHSDHAKDTSMYLAQAEHALMRHADASARYLEWIDLYPKDHRASALLLEVIELEDGLGHAKQAAELQARYVASYARKDVEKAARLVWSRRPKDPAALLDYAEAFVDKHKTRWPAGFLAAKRTIFELRWAKACRARLDDGLCVARRAARADSSCTLSGTPAPRVRARDSGGAAEVAMLLRWADEYAQRSRVHWELARDEEGVLLGLRAAVAFHSLEPELEAYLAAGPGAADARARAEALDRGYAELAELGDLDLAIRADARRGLIWEQLANAGLVRLEGVCTPLTRADEQLAIRATQAYRSCLALARESAWFNDAARRCEHALAFIEPDAVAPMVELVAEPEALVSAGIGSVGVVADPWLRTP